MKTAPTIFRQQARFVSGIAGIGKSELVKQYIRTHRSEYDNVLYWTFGGDLCGMVCNEHDVSVASFSREPQEDDIDYCKRKISKIKSLISKDTLTFIDNFNSSVDELSDSIVWQQIKQLPCKTIITTQAKEPNYAQVHITEINDISAIKSIFYRYCPSAISLDGQDGSIEQIINMVSGHTFEIELLAAYAEAEYKTPSDILDEIRKDGFAGLTLTSLSSLKDGCDEKYPLIEHLSRLLSLCKMSKGQQLLLMLLSCLPARGIPLNEFCAFYGISELDDINWMKRRCYISVSTDTSHTITIHSSISSVALELMKGNDQLVDCFFEKTLAAMVHGRDEQAINKRYFGMPIVETSPIDDNYRTRSRRTTSRASYLDLCKSLCWQVKNHHFNDPKAYSFIVHYVNWFRKYGFFSELITLLEYVVSEYSDIDYSSHAIEIEYAYDIYVALLLESENPDYSKMEELCRERKNNAKKNKLRSCFFQR